MTLKKSSKITYSYRDNYACFTGVDSMRRFFVTLQSYTGAEEVCNLVTYLSEKPINIFTPTLKLVYKTVLYIGKSKNYL